MALRPRSLRCLLLAGVRGEECRKSRSDPGEAFGVPSLMQSGGVTKNKSRGLYINTSRDTRHTSSHSGDSFQMSAVTG